ncbi:threonine/homoserine efflux transporter RhtA [Propionicimonas paludicola]|uniref:Threonine/homoserine efflux transporter RhtA n=1 Tax=Propionicimonas paludicola TaxID=185243 RepID=A0A2A9CT60_9ACTN|nr:DMT family transporter [Propionicimonas paludicola]PFG17316.1 threonine/homoserine efflux transporter RhtA [Propionicimonas paludicola]
MPTARSARRTRANLLLLLASAIWGFAFVAQRVGAAHVGPLTFNAVRFGLGALVVLAVIWWRSRRVGLSRERDRRAWAGALVPGVAAGIALTIASNLQQTAMSSVPAGNAAFITGLYMVFVPLIAAFRGHRSSGSTVLGVVSSVIGLYLIAVTDDLTIGSGEWLLILSTLVWAGQILVIDHYGKVSALRLAAVQFIVCSVLSGLGALVIDPAPFTGIDQAIIPILYGGILSVGIAFTLQVVGQRDALATHASLIMAMESVFGAIGGAVLLGESLGLRGFIGAILMVGGIVISQWGLARQSAAIAPDREPVAT